MNNFFIRTAAAIAAVLSSSLLVPAGAQAASLIEFSYDFDNGSGLVSGTLEGDIADDGTLKNITNLNATYSGQPDIAFNQFKSASAPIVSLGTIEESSLFDSSVPRVLFSMTNDAGDVFYANSLFTGQKAFLTSPTEKVFIQDTSEFGTYFR